MGSNSLYFIGTVSETEALPQERRAVFTHIVQDGLLLRSRSLKSASCGMAVLSGRGGDPSMAAQTVDELRQIDCHALLADVDSPALAAALDTVCAGEGIKLFVPDGLYAHTPHGTAVESASVTAGSYILRLKELSRKYGGRFAVDLTPLRAEFTLPSDGHGRELSSDELSQYLAGDPLTYFSSDLRAKYFTCRQNGATRFVVYDDGASLSEKVSIAESFGAEAVFMPCAEVRDFISELI